MLLRFVLAALLAATAPAWAAPPLPDAVLRAARDAGIPPEAIGLVVQRVADGTTLASHNAAKPLQPASTLKVLTALVALETLGPTYRGATELRAARAPVGEVLEGDLVLKGLGDVDLDVPAFERMLASLRAQGVRDIRGDFVLDRTFFDPPRADIGVPPFDEAPEFRYNIIPDALMLGSNLFRIELSSTERSVRTFLVTPLAGVEIVADELKLVDKPCGDWEDFWKLPIVKEADGVLRIRLQGEYPKNCTATTELNLIERVSYADRLFRALWTRLGGTFSGKTRDGVSPSEHVVLATHRSRALSQVVFDVNKRSDNPITRIVYLTLGALPPDGPIAPTAARSERIVRQWLAKRGIDDAGLVLENGSGLSRSERIRPETLAAVLRAGASSLWAPEFAASLPIVAGDGGMRTRLRDSSVGEGSRLKTGTLRDTSGVAGYVRTPSGETRIVVAIINHENAKKAVARPMLDALVDWAVRIQ